ncbi:Sprouty-related, EVH1 domain-containing protein 2, partial [Clarias magur]
MYMVRLLCCASLAPCLCCSMPIALSGLWRAQGSCFRFIQDLFERAAVGNNLRSAVLEATDGGP